MASRIALRATGEQRQRVQRACEECRRRKLRCDGHQPRCGVCVESGAACEINSHRQPRGPKKGYLKALRNRLGRNPTHCQPPLNDIQHNGFNASSLSNHSDSNSPEVVDNTTGSEPDLSILNTTNATSVSSVPSIEIHNKDISIAEPLSELMQAELNQLYFDRFHPSVQILHQRRYLGWARHTGKKQSVRCLNYAVWTLASLLSAQFRHLQDSFYRETKRLLELSYLTGNSDNVVDTEEIQAWVLIATYESMRAFHRPAWMSAGRAFRLVQLMRLHEIDSPTNSSLPDLDPTETEEKRRVFWMAYFWDHLLSMRNNWPITLNEHVICTRLPAPDADFQSGQPVLGAFLSEAIMDLTPQKNSPFNECVILATICGRSLFHAQQYSIRFVYGDLAPTWTDQQQWLDHILANRLRILSQSYTEPAHTSDPLLLFTHIMGQASVIHLYKGVQSVMGAADKEALVAEYHRRAFNAAQETVKLAKGSIEFNFLRIHPLMPIPLLLCAEFLYSNRGSDEAFHLLLQELLQIFRQLKNANDPSQSYMDLLGLSCTNTSIELVKENPTVP
ncbi:hypothetical protein N7512_006721 [Penicillium capsulatum]|nr:hypothetical protein N7512_006721 [Penicillium capsulatum]